MQALAAIAVGDLASAESLVASDFVWHVPGDGPISGEVHGAEEWSIRLQSLFAAGLQPTFLAILQGDDQVAVVQRNVVAAETHSLDVKVVNLFTVRDGKVARLESFFDDQRAVDQFWNRVHAN